MTLHPKRPPPKPRLADLPPVVDGFTVGYTPPRSLADEVKASGKRNLGVSIASLLGDHAVAYLAGGLAAPVVLSGTDSSRLAAAAAAALVVARAQRGLECMVHEASHYTISARRTHNDALGNVLAAIPMASTVAGFRESHRRHHQRFAVRKTSGYQTRFDPDIERSIRLRWDELDWTSRFRFTSGLIRRLPRYSFDWFKAIGSGRGTLALAVLWHTLAFVALAAVLGVEVAAVTVGIWMAAFTFVLPVYRFIAEAQEHDYFAGTNQFSTTISNTGLLNFWLHPHGDAHHAEHHCFQNRPGFRLRRLSKVLVDGDPAGWGSNHLHRTRLLGRPRRGHLPGSGGNTPASNGWAGGAGAPTT